MLILNSSFVETNRRDLLDKVKYSKSIYVNDSVSS